MSVGIPFLVLFTFTFVSFITNVCRNSIISFIYLHFNQFPLVMKLIKVKVNKTKNRIPTDISDETGESEGK
jgi:hypothetical protein